MVLLQASSKLRKNWSVEIRVDAHWLHNKDLRYKFSLVQKIELLKQDSKESKRAD